MLSIIIPTYNRNEVFYKTLACAYRAIADIEAEIIVVNDSKTNEVIIEEKFRNRVQFFPNPRKGVASARNYGASKSSGSLLLFLDDDVNLTEANLIKGIDFFKNNQFLRHCLNLSWEYPPSLTQQATTQQFGRFLINFGYTNMKGHSGNPAYWKENSQFEVEFFASYCLFMPRAIFDQLNGYKEEVPFGYEDYDFAYRAKQAGIKTIVDTANIVHHNEFDRVELTNWLNRKRTEGYGRKAGPKIAGHLQENKVEFSALKQIFFKTGISFKRSILGFLRFIPNRKMFDSFYFFIIKLLVGISFFEGYNKAKSELT